MPPPIGGWNTRDEPSALPLTDAIELINMIPRHGFTEMRGGYAQHSLVEGNSALQCDGTDYLQGADSAELDFAQTDFSIEFWTMHNSGTAANQNLVVKRTGTGVGYTIRADYNLFDIEFVIDDATTQVSVNTVSNSLPDDGLWHHFCITVDFAVEAIWIVDGVAQTAVSLTTVTDTITNASNFNVFADSAGGNIHENLGMINELRVWSDVRTEQEVRDNKDKEISATSTGLVGYWKMQGLVGAASATVSDSHANANDLTDTGAGAVTYIDASAAFSRVADIDMITEFYNGTTRQLLCATETNIYDSTAVGAATSKGSGFTTGRWDVGTMNGIMGFVNGADTPQKWDGTTLSTLTITGSGLTSSDLVGMHIFKSRSYFWEADNQSFWYSATLALGGALTEFALGQIAKKGGKLLRMASWTVDGGSGPDDYAVFIMDTGEIIVYQGDNPGSALSWGIVGIYNVGEIVNDRAYTNFGGSLLVVGENDVLTMPQAFQAETPPATKLSGAIALAVKNLSANAGWEMFIYPNQALMMINVPIGLTPDLFEQYVINTQNLTACRFTDIPARTWAMYNNSAYFGSSDGIVYKFDGVEADDGSDIDVTVKQAWTDFQVPDNKQVTALRPTFQSTGTMSVAMAPAYDYGEITIGSPSSTVTSGTAWGSAWGSSWGVGTLNLSFDWILGIGRGSAVSLNLKFSRQGDRPKWYKTDILIKKEGAL